MATLTHEREVRSPSTKLLSKERPPHRRRDREGKQQALIEAALQLFASKGFEATTTREIAAAAGCAEGLIHRYFEGKAGLLRALVEYKVSQEVLDLGQHLRPAEEFEQELLQLIAWEVDRAWETRDFFRVLIPRAMVDSSLASVMNQAVLAARTKAIAERLRCYPPCASLPPEELEVLVQSVGMLGLVFGFMRPIVLGQDRMLAKGMAATFARILIRGVHLQNR
jgi:TetR/AcrR family transcriptional regulator, regulator of cefoperazone and chloramphenicol sensitivity